MRKDYQRYVARPDARTLSGKAASAGGVGPVEINHQRCTVRDDGNAQGGGGASRRIRRNG